MFFYINGSRFAVSSGVYLMDLLPKYISGLSFRMNFLNLPAISFYGPRADLDFLYRFSLSELIICPEARIVGLF